MMKIMVLAGGNDQIGLIEELRKRFLDVEILLIDYTENPVAKKFADRHIVASTLDKEQILDIARKESIDLVITACTDQALLTMAYVSEELGLKCYLSYKQAQDLTNKLHMKKLMVESGIPTTNYRIFNISDEINIDGLRFPLVIKPVDNNSSNGVLKITSPDMLLPSVEVARHFSRSKTIIIEEFKAGEEFSVDAYIIGGMPVQVLISTSRKVKQNTNNFTINQSIFPVNLPSTAIHDIDEIICKISKAFSIQNAPLLLQLIYDGQCINVIEFSARTGGGSKHHFIHRLTGVNVMEKLLDITFGIETDISVSPLVKYAAMNYIYCKPGIICGIENMESLIDAGIITDYYLYKSIGTEILKAESSSDRPAGFLITAESEVELRKKVDLADKTLVIRSKEGEDIMLHGMYS
jgi:biotin carboxylase